MPSLIRSLWLAARALPWYVGFALLGLGVFAWGGLRGTRLLGDDNESPETANRLTGRSNGHARFYHK